MFISREPLAMRARLAQCLFIGVLIAAIFWQLTDFTKQDIQGLEGAMFMISTFMLMANVMGTVITF